MQSAFYDLPRERCRKYCDFSLALSNYPGGPKSAHIVYGSTCYIFSFAERTLLNSLTAVLSRLTYIGNKNYVGRIERLGLWNMGTSTCFFYCEQNVDKGTQLHLLKIIFYFKTYFCIRWTFGCSIYRKYKWSSQNLATPDGKVLWHLISRSIIVRLLIVLL